MGGIELRRTAFPGVVILDTGSDLGILTRNAIAASDLCVVPVADLESLLAARRIFELLEAWGRPRSRGRVVFSMIDQRIKYGKGPHRNPLELLFGAARRLDLPLCQSFISRSPSVQALATNPSGRTFSILYEAGRTVVHRQMSELAEELFDALDDSRRMPREGCAPEPGRREARDGPSYG